MIILIISFSDLQNDPRVYRQIKTLSRKYDIITAGFKEMTDVNTSFYEIRLNYPNPIKRLYKLGIENALLKKYIKYYKERFNFHELYESLSGLKFDLIIANDLYALPLAVFLKKGNIRLLYDAHEYSPRQLENFLLWRLAKQKSFYYLCREFLPEVDKMITVSRGIAEEYKRRFGVDSEILTNATFYQDIRPSAVDPKNIKIIHHGAATPARKMELMISAVKRLNERFTFDLYLKDIDNGRYLKRLKKIASSNKNIRFRDPVHMTELVTTLNKYDIGLYLLPPVNFNQEYALPNKFFEFLQARLAQVIGPSREMVRVLEEYDLGVTVKDFSVKELAKTLQNLDVRWIEHYKHQADKYAYQLSAENDMVLLENIVHDLINRR